jgi:pseudouridine-5'-phosphate glycosidase
VREMTARGIAGKETTPFLLAKVNEITGGDSLKANIALVENDARLAAEIAVTYARLTSL